MSEVLDLVAVQAVMTSGFTARGAWVARGEFGEILKFVALARGRVELTADGADAPLVLGAGDVAVLNGPGRLVMRGGPADGVPREIDVADPRHAPVAEEGADTLLGGHVALNAIGRSLLGQALPPVAHIRAASTAVPLRARLDLLLAEMTADQLGAAFALRQHAQLFVLDLLRVHLGRSALPPGWPRLLTDARLLPAVRLMHAEPGTAWRLETLARAAAMSRTTFATRFREVAGVPPLTYLVRWRMLLARRALREGEESVGALAASLGYASESAFSTAFRREVGEPPLRYRAHARRGSGA
ncbi:AraC-type DNA-binding protein [Streptomyces zhaozhouensis]|uniref:AraC-type DNA-binding protein n=2 Tax=Streptomyces zhaozhouensis TaxID=1300267 RepID=A0A286DQ57_9ACTN|nr:AraC-type DNA-binding protein [Streptomyces zhaozhouensis]